MWWKGYHIVEIELTIRSSVAAASDARLGYQVVYVSKPDRTSISVVPSLLVCPSMHVTAHTKDPLAKR